MDAGARTTRTRAIAHTQTASPVMGPAHTRGATGRRLEDLGKVRCGGQDQGQAGPMHPRTYAGAAQYLDKEGCAPCAMCAGLYIAM